MNIENPTGWSSEPQSIWLIVIYLSFIFIPLILFGVTVVRAYASCLRVRSGVHP